MKDNKVLLSSTLHSTCLYKLNCRTRLDEVEKSFPVKKEYIEETGIDTH